MKVLMTADTVGGVWSYSLDLSRALAGHGIRVWLATMGAPLSEAQRREAAGVPSLEVYESTFKLEWMRDPWDDVRRAGEWLLLLEGQMQPDVVHLNGYAHAALPWRAPVLVVGHSCVLSWWEAVRASGLPPEWDRYRDEVASGLRAADTVVAPTHAMLDALQRHYGPLPESRVVYNGVDAGSFAPAAKRAYVLTVGRLWDEAKNVSAVARVAPDLAWPVLVAGDERHPDGGYAGLLGVEMLGRLSREQLARHYATASIYALPALYEPFGLSALEAGLSGCALVLGDIPTLREVWADAAVFVPPGDTEALRGALRQLIADPDHRTEMAERARRRACMFTVERMDGGYTNIYNRLARTGAEVAATCA